jgi:CBS-domain-containing membrane protein
MTGSSSLDQATPLALYGKVAADLMTPSVLTIPVTATAQEAMALLTDENVGAVPVLDADGNSVGVISRSDLVAHGCDTVPCLDPNEPAGPGRSWLHPLRASPMHVFSARKAAATRVRDIMTPVVFSVARDTSTTTVVDAMLGLGVHRLFVTDNDGKLVGVISTIDILRHLHQQPPEQESVELTR